MSVEELGASAGSTVALLRSGKVAARTASLVIAFPKFGAIGVLANRQVVCAESAVRAVLRPLRRWVEP